MLESFLPFLIVLVISALVTSAQSKKNKKAKQDKSAQAAPRTAPRPARAAVDYERAFSAGAAPAETSDAAASPRPAPAVSPRASDFVVDGRGFDSEEEYHEGEDPCHDDMEAVPASPFARPEPRSGVDAQELVRGFVISEILSRRPRR